MRVPTSVFGQDGPLDETREAAHVVTAAVADSVRAHMEETRDGVKRAAAGAAACVLAGAGVAAVGPPAAGAGLIGLGVLGGGLYAWRVLGSGPDVRVVEAEKRYWTGHVVPQPEGAFVYDATGSVARTELEVEELEDMSLLHESADTFSGEMELPVVQTSDHDVESSVRERLSSTRAEVESAETVRFEAPLADTSGEVVREIAALPTEDADGDVRTDSVEFELAEATEQARRLRETETMAFETDAEENLAELKADSEEAVRTLTETKEDAIGRLNEHVDVAGDITSMTSYHFYCPDCIQDDIESALSLEFADGPRWFCETCRSQFETDDEPVPKHRMKADLVEEVWDRLWIEKDDERRSIYENIEDQKVDLKEREFEQRQEAIRNAWNRIKDIRSKIRDLETEAKAERGATEEIGAVMEKYDRLGEERRAEFESDVEEALTRIERETQDAIEEMRNYEERKIEESQEAAEERAEVIRAEEQARHKEKLAALESLEETQEELLEHEKESHRKEMLLETQGGTSAFDLMNKYQMKKGEMFGFSKGE